MHCLSGGAWHTTSYHVAHCVTLCHSAAHYVTPRGTSRHIAPLYATHQKVAVLHDGQEVKEHVLGDGDDRRPEVLKDSRYLATQARV